MKGKLICGALAALILAACASASGQQTRRQAEAAFRTCLLKHGAVKVTLPRGDKVAGHVWFRRPVRTRWDKHSGWWGMTAITVGGTRYYAATYQVGGMSARERRTLDRCGD